ncbi:protein FAM177A1-like [Boleophthalmus pectinirostris]|uniref:protein FAM177A1-like n=1 Tax=Boleophthalmus pectinirostris TaxID=150288 RepID=UPI00242BA259|nr:protein FAM177A1-like [Boleophthalmus pectinirostris]
MADISLYLTNVNVSVTRNMDGEESSSPSPVRDFESVELGELERPEEHSPRQKEKVPRRIIHFSSGETMEEYSTDEEDEEEAEKKDLLPQPAPVSKMTWGPYFWFHMWRAATSTISACDYLGERMANLFGITSAKYQYAIDEYYRIKKEREEEQEETRLSEVAERTFDQTEEDEEEEKEQTPKPRRERDTSASDVGFQIENENQVASNTIRVPAIVTAT